MTILRADPILKGLDFELLLLIDFVLMSEHSSDGLVVFLEFREESGELLMTLGCFESFVKSFG